MPEKKERPKMEFATNVPADVILGKNFKSGTGEYGAWHGWNLTHDGEEKVIFAKDALHDKIKGYPENAKLRIVYAEKKGETGKYNEWEISPLNGTAKMAAAQPTPTAPAGHVAGFTAHLLACADTAIAVAEKLGIVSDEARQACFATVCIDAQRRGVVLDTAENGNASSTPTEAQERATPEQRKAIGSLCKSLEIPSAKAILADVGCVDPEQLTSEQAGRVIELLQKQENEIPF